MNKFKYLIIVCFGSCGSSYSSEESGSSIFVDVNDEASSHVGKTSVTPEIIIFSEECLHQLPSENGSNAVISSLKRVDDTTLISRADNVQTSVISENCANKIRKLKHNYIFKSPSLDGNSAINLRATDRSESPYLLLPEKKKESVNIDLFYKICCPALNAPLFAEELIRNGRSIHEFSVEDAAQQYNFFITNKTELMRDTLDYDKRISKIIDIFKEMYKDIVYPILVAAAAVPAMVHK